MEKREKFARVVLGCDYNLKPLNFLPLLEQFGSAQSILSRMSSDISINTIVGSRKSNVSQLIDLEEVLVLGEEKYPKLLEKIIDPPMVLFFKGDLSSINFDKCIGIVGTRKISKYGISVTKGLVKFLVEHGYTIVSGLAYGIDALAHEETLINGGQTIGVLGTAINDPYPQSNRWLYKKIINNSGLILSESKLTVDYGKWMFPKRNRIIAGLCKKLIVIEAPEKSGALITANYASGYFREVYGVPGDVFSLNSMGIHKLIKDKKAEILSKYEDILENDQLVFKMSNNQNSMVTTDEKEVLKSILLGNTTIESLVENLRYDINMLLSMLGRLELNNIIERFEDGSFVVK